MSGSTPLKAALLVVVVLVALLAISATGSLTGSPGGTAAATRTGLTAGGPDGETPAASTPPATRGPISTPDASTSPRPGTVPASGAPSTTPVAPGEQPDIVVVLLDDVPYLDGRLMEAMPNIRRIFLEHGTTYTSFHGETPLCCPGRAGFLTGQHTHNNGVRRNDGRFFDPEMTIATALDDVGYQTFLAGKYLNLYDRFAPTVPPGWDRFHAIEGPFYDYYMWSNGHPGVFHGRSAKDYSTDVIARRAAAEIRAAPLDSPIFAWVSPYAAHLPRTPAPRHLTDERCAGMPAWSPPNYMEADVSDKPGYILRRPVDGTTGFDLTRICRTLLSADDLVASVSDALAETGRLDDAVFILTSDNGMNYGAHRVRDDKKTPYSTHIPFMVSWPARLGDAGRTVEDRLMNIDLAPTLCQLAGCTLGPYPGGQPTADGASFADLLTDSGPPPRRGEILHSYLVPTGWVPRWWAVATTASSDFARRDCAAAAERGCRWFFVDYETGETELYDLSGGNCWEWSPGGPGDPCMLENRSGNPSLAALEADLEARLRELH